MGYLPYQLVQDFFHQRYHLHPIKTILSTVEKFIAQVQSNAKMHIGGAPCESQVASGWFWEMTKFGGFVDEPTWRWKDFKLKLPVCLLNLMMYVDVDVSCVCRLYFPLVVVVVTSPLNGVNLLAGDECMEIAKSTLPKHRFASLQTSQARWLKLGTHTRCHSRWAYSI